MHLSDCFIELMAYVSRLVRSAAIEQPPYEEVKREIDRRLSEAELQVARAGVALDEYDLARFAVCAWIDETILGSPWQHRSRWLNDQLQRLHYHTTDAGEEFYQRLEKLPPHQREVREVYYLCLAMGFLGRHGTPGAAPQLEQLKISNLKTLLDSPSGVPSLAGADLFPEAYPANTTANVANAQKSSRLVTAVCLAAPVLLFLILYLVYRFTLSGVSDNFLRTVAS